MYAGVRMPTWCNQLSSYDMDTCSSMRVRALQSRREPCSECVLCCAFHVHVGLAGAGSCGAGVLRAHRRASVRSRVCVCVCVCVWVCVCVYARARGARACVRWVAPVSVPDVGQVLTVAVTVRKSGTCFA